MAKLTKKSYQRKAMVMGGVIFASCALFATGFAAFVVSSSASNAVGGNVNVGTIKNQSVKFEDVKLDGVAATAATDVKFSFDARKDDQSGRVRSDGLTDEKLSVKVTGTFYPLSVVNDFTVRMRMGKVDEKGEKAVPDTADEDQLKACETAGYLVLPECFNDTVHLSLTDNVNIKKVGEEDKATFEYTVTFAWGSHFNGQNPSDFYDTDDAISSYPDVGKDNYLDDLKKFYTTITGDANADTPTLPNDMGFVIELNASTSGTRA